MMHGEKSTKPYRGERRRNWRDRRVGEERRNPERLKHMDGECRSNVPRRSSDLAGKLEDGEYWWSGDRRFF